MAYVPRPVCTICFDQRNTRLYDTRCLRPQHHPAVPFYNVVIDRGCLVLIRPLPQHFRPPGFFGKCLDGSDCLKQNDCTYAHSFAEMKAWNLALENERKTTPYLRRSREDAIVRSSHCSYKERQANPPPFVDMQLPVTLGTYKEKFAALLYYEEQAHIELLRKKCDGDYNLVQCRQCFLKKDEKDYSNFYCLTGMSSAQIMYATQASDRFVYISIGLSSYKAKILSRNYIDIDDKLYIGLKECLRNHSLLRVSARFEVNHSYFDNLNKGVERIDSNILRCLLPEPEDFKAPRKPITIDIRRHPYRGIDLDPDQYPALEVILSNQCSAPVIIPGAFGTGKTRLLAVATECLFREYRETAGQPACRILICCHHQHSADTFMVNYFNTMLHNKRPWPVTVVRVTSSRYHTDYPHVEAAEFELSPYRHEMSFLLVTTFGGALSISRKIGCDFFTHILIDEGAQTREPEALSPFLMANRNTRIVIAGDHQQVGPQLLVLGEAPQKFGLCISLLQRLLKRYRSIGDIAMKNAPSWNVNYRSQADLLELPSKLFYDSKLRACGRVPFHLKAPYPYVFICSSFSNIIPVSSHCQTEAGKLLQAVKFYSDNYKSWELKDTCIMTPSLKQANLIKSLIKKDFKSLDGVNVITSYQMQGQEYRMLFMSTVESLESNGRPYDPLKSFCNPALFNTAITRSKSLVVAVGNPLVLLMSEATMDEPKWCWREFISRCLGHETFKGDPSDSAQYKQVEGQFFDMLKCDDPTVVMSLFRKNGYSRSPPYPPAMNQLQHSSCQPLAAQYLRPSKEQSFPLGSSKDQRQSPSQAKKVSSQQAKPPSSQRQQSSSSQKAVKQQTPSPKQQQPPSARTPSAKQQQPPSARTPSAKQQQPPSARTPSAKQQQPPSARTPSAKQQQPPSAKTPSAKTPSAKTPSAKQIQSSDSVKRQKGQPGNQLQQKLLASPQTSVKCPSQKQVTPKKQSQQLNSSTSHLTVSLNQQSPTIPPQQKKQSSKESTCPWKPLPPVDAISLKSTINTSKPLPVVSRKRNHNIPENSTLQKPGSASMASFLRDEQRATLEKLSQHGTHPQRNSISKEFFMKHEHRPTDINLLKAKLTKQNYKEKFHQLLCREEEEHDRILIERCDGIHTLIILNGHSHHKFKDAKEEHIVFGRLFSQKLDADAMAYAHQASECQVVLQLPSGEVQADILLPIKRDHNCLYLGFTELPGINQQAQVYVAFILKFSYFDRLHKAIQNLTPSVIDRLMPSDCSNFTASTLKVSFSQRCPKIVSLEYSQNKALETIMKCESSKAPALIIGSFGTGKTRLLARAAYEILEKSSRNRVLICAHHQHSADCFIEDYFSKIRNCSWSSNIIRLVPSKSYRCSKPSLEEYYQTWSAGFSNRRAQENTRLVITTFSTSLHLFLYAHINPGFFTHILLDEGAQTREPESVAPLCLADDNTQIVIAGDHKQVGPSLLVLGEDAVKYGLSQSLLERLHQVYNSKHLDNDSRVAVHCATLLTNFRCHHAILSLPSYLFYDSALISAADAVTHLHPQANYPLHFICSSLSDEKEVQDDINDFEVELLLREVLKYVSDWPKQWGKRNLAKICVMATTAHQKGRVISAIRGKDSFKYIINEIEVKTVFDIQGCEYEAIFLSTAEPTTIDGRSKNPTKTPCSQYVFNTALTRAKSLVVCAGNPFLLMTIEKSMNNESSCWKEYIRRCIISKTFILPSHSRFQDEASHDRIKELREIIFSADSSNVHISPKDTILKSFQKALKSIPCYKKSKLRIIQEHTESKWDIVQEHVDETTSNDDGDDESEGWRDCIIDCELQISNQRSAVAIPLDRSKEPITINGFNNRKGAFNNDIVKVEVTVFPSDDDTQVKKSGRVIKVIEEQHPTRYVCRADQYGLINFYPLDITAPVIVNLPKISQNLLRYRPKEDQVPMIRDYITVFKEDSLSMSPDDSTLPCIKELIPFDLSHSLLFVVEVLGWNPKYRKALGAVIEAVPRTSSLFFTNHLLKLVYGVHEEDEGKAFVLPSGEGEREGNLCHYDRAFTIDPPSSTDLDDAVSLTPLPEEGSYELAILIANVAKSIPQGHPLDERAKSRGTSVYGVGRVSHMFPSCITSQLSLDHMQKRHVLCVPATVIIKEGIIDSVVCGGPKKALVTSQVRFTYESAKKVMNGEELVGDDETRRQRRQVEAFDAKFGSSLSMADTLRTLYKIVMKLRLERLGDAGYCYDPPEKEGEEDNWQTHLLIEELMIFCNAAIAEYLHDGLPKQAVLLRVQQPPIEEEMQSYIEKNRHCLQHSLSLKRHLKDSTDNTAPLTVSSTTLQLLIDVCQKGDHIQLASILSNNRLYPQLAIAESMSRSISRRSKYVAIKKKQQHSCKDHAHSSLSLGAYTHFTSPIRRYFDLVVHRLVTSLIEGRGVVKDIEKLVKLCSHLNVKKKMAQDFERADKKADITRKCELSLEKAEAFVIGSLRKPNAFELSFTSNNYQDIHGRDTSFSTSDLNPHHQTDDGIVWKVTSISLGQSPNCLLSHPDISYISDDSQQKSMQCSIAVKVYQYECKEATATQLHVHCSSLKVKACDKVIKISPDDWQVTQQYLKSQNEENLGKVKDLLCPLQPTTEPVAKPNPDQENVAMTYEIQRPFSAGEVLTVWLGKSLKQYLPTPGVQLMEVAPTVRVCLQHNQNPALCFSDVQLKKASLSVPYHSLEEYVNLWSKVLIAESANDSVKTKNLIFIRDAPLQWHRFARVDNCVDDVYYIPQNELSLTICPSKQDSLDFINIKSGDFLCVRYEIREDLNAVYHFVVSKVKREEDKKKKNNEQKEKDTVIIKIHPEGDQSCRVTKDMYEVLKERTQPCDIQIVSMPDSFHRVYARLKEVVKPSNEWSEDSEQSKREWSELSKMIAIGDTNSSIFSGLTAMNADISMKVFNEEPLVKEVWGDVPGIELNKVQKESIKKALKNKFQLIQGPPGTGKSETGAHLAYIFSLANKKIAESHPFNKKFSVLYCGPSNKSVDVVHEKLQSLNNKLESEKKLRILRIYGRTHERKVYPDPVHDLTKETRDRDEDDAGRCLKMFHNEALHEIIRHNCSEIGTTEKELNELLEKGIIPSSHQRRKYKDLITFEEYRVIDSSYDIILCTCNETCSQRMLHAKGRIAQCIVDECGMATEPETISATSLCEHVVLIGDHKQLQPVIKYPPAKECGLGTSLFERYATLFEKTNDPHLITLELQYRMHRFICQGPSDIFYFGKLKPDRSVEHRDQLNPLLRSFWPRGLNFPILFLKVYGVERFTDNKHSKKVDSHSKCNDKEADEVLKCIKKLVTQHNVKCESIAVLTPYGAQKSLIIEKIKNDSQFQNWSNPKVATIVESQGDEYDIVILTTVRSQRISEISHKEYVQPDKRWLTEKLGFLTDEHQINVGITRAKHGLIIIGNDRLLKYDVTWKELISLYEKERCTRDRM